MTAIDNDFCFKNARSCGVIQDVLERSPGLVFINGEFRHKMDAAALALAAAAPLRVRARAALAAAAARHAAAVLQGNALAPQTLSHPVRR